MTAWRVEGAELQGGDWQISHGTSSSGGCDATVQSSSTVLYCSPGNNNESTLGGAWHSGTGIMIMREICNTTGGPRLSHVSCEQNKTHQRTQDSLYSRILILPVLGLGKPKIHSKQQITNNKQQTSCGSRMPNSNHPRTLTPAHRLWRRRCLPVPGRRRCGLPRIRRLGYGETRLEVRVSDPGHLGDDVEISRGRQGNSECM
jgi:hypothetical protein